jgi:hypothetical protein
VIDVVSIHCTFEVLVFTAIATIRISVFADAITEVQLDASVRAHVGAIFDLVLVTFVAHRLGCRGSCRGSAEEEEGSDANRDGELHGCWFEGRLLVAVVVVVVVIVTGQQECRRKHRGTNRRKVAKGGDEGLIACTFGTVHLARHSSTALRDDDDDDDDNNDN